jgi:cytochrome c biogenesis protein CcdA
MTDPAVLAAIDTATLSGAEASTLDPLYNAFLLPGSDPKPPRSGPNIPVAHADLVRELERFTTPQTAAGIRFRASINLARSGQSAGYTALLRDLPSLTTAQKTTLCESLYQPSRREAVELLTQLLRDPVPEVRKAAAECAMSNEKARALIQLVLNEVAKPGALLQAQETYNSRFESAASSPANKSLIRHWSLSILKAPKADTPLRILAVIAARNGSNSALVAAIQQHSTSPDPNLRRAAWQALLTARPASLAEHAAAIAADPEAFVREVLPQTCSNERYGRWIHRFSDTHSSTDERSTYNRAKRSLTEPLRTLLQGLTSHDPSPRVRFEASFALLTHGVPTDLESLASLVPRLPADAQAPRRISNWLEENSARATPALAPLLALVPPGAISASKLKPLLARIQPSQGKGFATFASLAETIPQPDAKPGPLLTAERTVKSSPPARTSLALVFFYKPGCPECTKAKQELIRLRSEFPLLQLTELNILEASSTVLNQALCARFAVPAVQQTVSPALFTQDGFLTRNSITPQAISELLAKTMASPQDDSWLRIGDEEQQAASLEVERRYEAFTLPVVIGAGLLDGVNPCAFATIILFLSYLQIARRTPREMLLVGAAFISAVFIAYLAAGLLLHEMLGALNQRFSGLQIWMNYGFAALALIAAFLSFRDALRARSGHLREMTLQLPGFLKERIRRIVRTGARARNFVAAAFISGLLISLMELACTGQVYAPIIYQIQRGKLDALLWLVIYNLAFITPLIVIFLLAYGGLRSETLVAFQAKHTAAVKIALGLLFLVLALVILLGPRFLGA